MADIVIIYIGYIYRYFKDTLMYTKLQSKLDRGEIAVEVAVNFLRAVILNLDTRGNRRAFWRSRAALQGQQRSSFGGGDLCSEARGSQG